VARADASCAIVLVADCHACTARTDPYFQRHGMRCLARASLDAVGDTNPPLNGGIVLGSPAALRRLYVRAAALAAAQETQCRADGRDQHLLTAAAFALQRALRLESGSAAVCVLPNDPSTQSAAANLGVNNRVKGLLAISATTGFVESVPLREPIALLHQFDRRRNIDAFINARANA